ncbi:MAG: flagellar biosynthesis protein FlhF [Desulfitobacteriaceae bacterium]|nr:flagellar biosynthesis protein FlhF [Desulfitobacteriaceae bacterium]MDI6878867.1 flagellar biosynthesis protein FlhF [Desulfitobacteriaceae bacterium]MDI6914512.1 flagellar biosynthesis protein FlhF [Desulfitobacteriaceae bacterium]
MRVKRFVGENVAETMGKVKRELGSEAVILQTRQFKEGGFLGFFGKMKVEITAAIEDRPATKRVSPASMEAYVAAARSYSGYMERETQEHQAMSAGVSGGVGISAGNRVLGGTPGMTADAGDSLLQQELRQMQSMLLQMNKQLTTLGQENVVWPGALQAWAERLRERGIQEPLVRRLLRQVQQSLSEPEWEESEAVWANIEDSVRRMCAQTAVIQPGVQKPRIVALVGPTGVGKTTTIGKLAAGFSIVDKRKVALITADTYRVAAVEQLKTFGEIIGVPVDVVMTPSGLREALSQHADKELIFIDTAGRSPQHELHMSELRAFLDRAQADLTLLAMSATTNTADQIRVLNRFAPLATHLIFTKLDETMSPGNLLNVIDQTSLPVAYLTTGQNVPDDIEAATPARLTRYILGEGSAHA